MATYKSEFLYHYYKENRRPLTHYAIGMIPLWARLARVSPGMANATANFKPVKWLLGIHTERQVPPFAKTTFRERFVNDQSFTKPNGAKSKGRVILWTDTFNNYYTPQVLQATAEVIRDAGWQVVITKKNICCGRPYYDFGMLDHAKNHLRELMSRLGPELNVNTWIVGVEPSCIAVFRDELRNVYPDDPRAKKLAERTLMLGEFLNKHTEFSPPLLKNKMIVHGHCHQKSVLGMQDDEALLRKMGNVEMLDSGCCGMAGSFGYEKEKYPVSKTIFKQSLGDSLGAANDEDIIVANGFSCRTQIAAMSKKQALALPEVLAGYATKGEAP